MHIHNPIKVFILPHSLYERASQPSERKSGWFSFHARLKFQMKLNFSGIAQFEFFSHQGKKLAKCVDGFAKEQFNWNLELSTWNEFGELMEFDLLKALPLNERLLCEYVCKG